MFFSYTCKSYEKAERGGAPERKKINKISGLSCLVMSAHEPGYSYDFSMKFG